MNRDRVQQFKHVIRQYTALGVTERRVREAVIALRDGTDPSELATVLGQYVPRRVFIHDSRPMVELTVNERAPAGRHQRGL